MLSSAAHLCGHAAIGLVNDHAYGNGTAIFTRDGDAAHAFANNVKIGMVGINVPIPVPVAYHSFGGWKASIFGDHGVYGRRALLHQAQDRDRALADRHPRRRGVRVQGKELGFVALLFPSSSSPPLGGEVG